MVRRSTFTVYPVHSRSVLAPGDREGEGLAYWTSRSVGYVALLTGFAIAAFVIF